jgi:hypothetical protein
MGEVCGWCRCRSSNSSRAVSRRIFERHHVVSRSRIEKADSVWSHVGSSGHAEFVCKMWARFEEGGGDKFARARRTRYPELRRCASSWISAARTAGSQCLIRTAAFAGGYYTTTLKRPVIRRAAVNLHRSSVSERCPEAFLIRPIAVSDYLFKLNLGREPTRSGRKRSSIDTTNQRQSCFCCNEGAIVEVRL